MKELNDEVIFADEPVLSAARGDMASLVERSKKARRKRFRLCAHRDSGEKLHEMFIVHPRGTYVRPHKHLGKAESMHVIEGETDVVFFDDDGKAVSAVRLGDYASGKEFYLRNSDSRYHTLLIRSDMLVFHEVTTGPFQREDTAFPAWAPQESDAAGVERFMKETSVVAERLLKTPARS